jgi:hypothetical protein
MYSTGDRVSQQQYGDGTVLVCNEHHTIVDFDAHGARTFVTRLARFDSCSTAAPIKPVRTRRPRKTAGN